MARLTDSSIQNLKPRAERYEVSDGGTALRVVVHPTGKKSFAVRYRFGGKAAKLTLSGGITLAAARKHAADAALSIEQGVDPGAAKQAAKAKTVAAKADTVQAVCAEWLARKGSALRTVGKIEIAFRKLIYPQIGNVQIGDLRRSHIIRLIDKIEDNNGKRRADLAQAYLRTVFNWHALRSDDFHPPIVRGMSRYSTKEHARSRVLTDNEIRALWKATESAAPFHALVRFLLFTGCRHGEVAGLTWPEIVDGIWNLPASRNKTKVDLARPLSKAALAIIELQPRIGDGPLVFSGDGHRRLDPGKPVRALRAAIGVADWSLHDLRRTARTLLSRAGVNSDVGERCLGHVIGGVRGTCDRHKFQDEMAEAFEALAQLVERVVNPPTGSNVRQLRRRG